MLVDCHLIILDDEAWRRRMPPSDDAARDGASGVGDHAFLTIAHLHVEVQVELSTCFVRPRTIEQDERR